MTARCLAVLGTASDVGKSITAAALCRIFARMGLRTAPYKAQNMSNNAAVVPGIGEMARAQVVQAEAAGVVPHPDMNPVLLKPNTETGSQVVVCGKVVGVREARSYFRDTTDLRAIAHTCLDRLRAAYDLVVIEGAGSCAEVNLRATDFVNFDTAHHGDAPVLLVADIDRGGVFAQVVGTLAVLPPHDRARVAGILINRFRGDASLFDDGRAWLARETGLPVLGLVPYFRHITIEAEDGFAPDTVIDPRTPPARGTLTFAVVRLPHIANFTDFTTLQREPEISLAYYSRPSYLHTPDVLILPGSKNVRADLAWLHETGWAAWIRQFAADGGRVVGICGGYQMLGRSVSDPHGVEGAPGTSDGLDLLAIRTTLARDKIVRRARGHWLADGTPVSGYEIHMGRTERLGAAPVIAVTETDGSATHDHDGAVGGNGRIWGTYFHGIFESAAFRAHLPRALRPGFQLHHTEDDPSFRDTQYDLLADHFEKHLDMPRLRALVGLGDEDSP